MLIRPATSDDATVIAQLNTVVQQLHFDHEPDRFLPPDVSAFVPVVEEWLRRDNVRAFIAEGDGEALGYVLAVAHERLPTALTRGGTFVELDQIAVLPQKRGRGIGRRLADEVFGYAKSLDADNVVLSVWEFNADAQRFFADLGFAPMWHRMSAPTKR